MFYTEFCCRRMNLNLWRARVDFFARMFLLVSSSFFLWIFILRLGDNLSTIQDRMGLVYESIAIPPMVGVLNAVALCEYQFFQADSYSNIYCAVTLPVEATSIALILGLQCEPHCNHCTSDM